MKISNVDDTLTTAIQQYQKSEKVTKESDKQSTGVAAPDDKVNLSATAKDIQQLQKAVSELPDIRQDKVEDLKTKIGMGNYDVSGEKIADKMLGDSIHDIFA